MEIEIAFIKVAIINDISRQMASVQVHIECDPRKEEDLINGIAEALISQTKFKEIFNQAVKKANAIRQSENN